MQRTNPAAHHGFKASIASIAEVGIRILGILASERLGEAGLTGCCHSFYFHCYFAFAPRIYTTQKKIVGSRRGDGSCDSSPAIAIVIHLTSRIFLSRIDRSRSSDVDLPKLTLTRERYGLSVSPERADSVYHFCTIQPMPDPTTASWPAR
jgi:hypothetical protein